MRHWVNLSIPTIHRDTAEDDKAHSLFLDDADDFAELLGASAQPADLGCDDGTIKVLSAKRLIMNWRQRWLSLPTRFASDLLGLTYSQQSIIGSGGYMPEDVYDVQNIMASGKWNLESIITHEFPLEQLEVAIRTAADPQHSGSVVIKM